MLVQQLRVMNAMCEQVYEWQDLCGVCTGIVTRMYLSCNQHMQVPSRREEDMCFPRMASVAACTLMEVTLSTMTMMTTRTHS